MEPSTSTPLLWIECPSLLSGTLRASRIRPQDAAAADKKASAADSTDLTNHLHDPRNLQFRPFHLDATLAIWPYYNCHMTITAGGLYGTNPDCRGAGWSKGFEPSNLRIRRFTGRHSLRPAICNA